MQVKQSPLKDIPPKSNPFNHDHFHMGQSFGKNHMPMFPNHASEPLKYFILIDTNTGKRIKFTVEPDEVIIEDAGVESLKRDLAEVNLEDTLDPEPTS